MMDSNESIIVMFIVMVIASIITGMNLFVNKISDIRLNINDFYMGTNMTGIMFLLLGIYYKSIKLLLVGFLITVIIFTCLRMQTFVGMKQYLNSMIPHHSMAIMMTKKLQEKKQIEQEQIRDLLENIIDTQEKEIVVMKKLLEK